MFTTVSTQSRGFLATPSYVVSLVVHDMKWRASGDVTLYSPSTSRFQLRLGRLVDGSQLSADQQVTQAFARGHLGVNYVGYTLPVNMPGGNPNSAVLTLQFSATLQNENLATMSSWKQRQFAQTLAVVLGMQKSDVKVASCEATHYQACSKDGGCLQLTGVNLKLELQISAKYCALQGLQNCDPLAGRLGLADYIKMPPFKKMLVNGLLKQGIRVRVGMDTMEIEQVTLVENRNQWRAGSTEAHQDVGAWAKQKMKQQGNLTRALIGFLIAGGFAFLSINLADCLFKRRGDAGSFRRVLPGAASPVNFPSSYIDDRDTPSPSPERVETMQEYGRAPAQMERRGLLAPA